MSRDPLTVLRNQAGMHAPGAHARGDQDERRRWLDVLILLDQHDAREHTTTKEPEHG
jgi:hypothetical protein